MANVLLAVAVVLLILAHAALTGFLVVRPARVIQIIMAMPTSRHPVVIARTRFIAKLPPWFWLLEGRSAEDVLEVAPTHPEEFPRMVAAIRLLGAAALGVNVGIVLLLLAMIAFA